MSALAVGTVFASSHSEDPRTAMEEIMRQIGEDPLAGLLIFCSHRYDRDTLARAINLNSEGLPVIGCTSSGELTEAGYDQDSLTCIGFPRSAFNHSLLRASREKAARLHQAPERSTARACECGAFDALLAFGYTTGEVLPFQDQQQFYLFVNCRQPANPTANKGHQFGSRARSQFWN